MQTFEIRDIYDNSREHPSSITMSRNDVAALSEGIHTSINVGWLSADDINLQK
jgi:hypothetical protein